MLSEEGMRKLAFLGNLFRPSKPTYDPYMQGLYNRGQQGVYALGQQRVVDKDYSDRASTLGLGAAGVVGGLGAAYLAGAPLNAMNDVYSGKEMHLDRQIRSLSNPKEKYISRATLNLEKGGVEYAVGPKGKPIMNITPQGDQYRQVKTYRQRISPRATRRQAMLEQKQKQLERVTRNKNLVKKWGRPAVAAAGAIALPMAYNYFFGD